MTALSISSIRKEFGDVVALNNVSLEVEAGELFGIIGPDGAGKTTLFRLIASLLVPTSGSIAVLQLDSVRDYKEIRKRIGYMPGKFSLYPDLTVEENLSFFASVFGTTIEQNYELIRDVYKMLEPFKNRPAGKLSGGMKQKLALSCALIHKPDLLLLDEPTTGVDAVSRKEFWEMLRKLKKHSITIVVSTPYMDEASLCDRVALVQGGEVLKVASPGAIVNSFGKPLYSLTTSNIYGAIKALRAAAGVQSAFAFGQDVHVVLQGNALASDVEQVLCDAGINQPLCRIDATIEDCFMDLMAANELETRKS
jgi:ABC-type multidrug transport system ATPase subunit